MQFRVVHGDTLAVDLAAGESVKAESDALVTMSHGLSVSLNITQRADNKQQLSLYLHLSLHLSSHNLSMSLSLFTSSFIPLFSFVH